MRIRYDFEYDACYDEIADEFCDHDSEYQSNVLNEIGTQFKIWSQDKARSSTYIQLMEIAEDLDDNGKWFIETLCDYMSGKVESENKE